MIAGSQENKLKKMRQKYWQHIATLWQMQQNMCLNQDDDAISSMKAYRSEYGIVSVCLQALTNS